MTYADGHPSGLSLVDAILSEVGAKLRRLAAQGEPGVVELRGLPLAPSDMSALDAALGLGEVKAEVHVSGLTAVIETAWPGVWRVRHHAADGTVISDEISISPAPDILAARLEDIRDCAGRFSALLHPEDTSGETASNGENIQ